MRLEELDKAYFHVEGYVKDGDYIKKINENSPLWYILGWIRDYFNKARFFNRTVEINIKIRVVRKNEGGGLVESDG